MRTVLLLLNGLGIESKESYEVYDETIMPNFDKLCKKYMMAKLDSTVFNTVDGFRNMSLQRTDLYNYSIYNREAANSKIAINPVVNELNKKLIERKSKLHILCFVDTSLQLAENLKHFI